jgi:hypothetical protein
MEEVKETLTLPIGIRPARAQVSPKPAKT